jgi:hypothetical protein
MGCSQNTQAIQADFEILVDGKETSHQPDTQGFNKKHVLKTALDDSIHHRIEFKRSIFQVSNREDCIQDGKGKYDKSQGDGTQ